GELSAKLGPEQAKWEEEAKAKAAPGLPKEVAAALAVEPAKRNPQQKEALAKFYRTVNPQTAPAQKQLDEVQAKKTNLTKALPSTLVAMAGPPRIVGVLPRGNWLDDSGEIVLPDVPAALPPLAPQPKKRHDRLDLAHWLVTPENPLTARVFVNRL